ncbi:hypothetical protein HG536_0A07520 [Torulaspora globosa]|uniref:Uncharacterized protein n=1 Tax=Torulaspora globosa TaxID=48254 RepID=A0A7G3ZBQ1_9SACH|nr:uncharacterized protein HG536_0A07520 [Torulaspora globosa]QLL30937.1 hypothetical protein HG536_0A07520 [Torulaspora globosa]
MTSDIKKNKVRNEEYKIWKKTVPFLYQHISSVRPKFSSRVDDALKSEKRLTFSDKVIPDKKKGLLSTSVLYSQGSDIYEIDCELPLGAFYERSDEDAGKTLPDPDYGDAFVRAQEEVPTAKWTFLGESVTKLAYLGSGPGDSNLLAMSKNGSLAWFRNGIKVPVHIMQEIMGPGTSFSSIHSYTSPEELSVSDFALSDDFETLVKCQSNGKEEESIVKIVDNSGTPGEVLRKINIPATVTHTVRFFDNHLFATCSDDNVLRFWDTRTEGKPLWDLKDPNHGRILSFDVSPVVDTLFATGTDTGIVKVWDVRAVVAATTDYTNRQHGQDPEQNELINFYHSGGDSVVDVQFSYTSSSEFLTVGGSGNVYQWDLDYFFSEYGDENADTVDMDIAKADVLQSQCLKFLHTGGSRRSIGANGKRNTVAYHPVIDDLVGVVDQDSLITVYKAFTGRDDDNDEKKKSEKAEPQADAFNEH